MKDYFTLNSQFGNELLQRSIKFTAFCNVEK